MCFRSFISFVIFGILAANSASANPKGHKRSRSIESSEEFQNKANAQVLVALPIKAPNPVYVDPIRNAVLEFFSGVEEGSLLLLKFDERVFPVEMSRRGNDLTFEVPGKFGASGHACLLLNANLLHKSGRVDRISAANGNCPLIGAHHGTALLKFVDALSQVLNLEEIALFDHSEIRDEITGVTLSLRFLRTLLKGAGWYESHGYLPAHDESYRVAVERFRNFPLSQLRARLAHLNRQDWFEMREDFFAAHWAELVTCHGEFADSMGGAHNEYFGKIGSRSDLVLTQLDLFSAADPLAASTDHLHSFLSWLWTHDRASFVEIRDFLFPMEIGLGIDLGLGTYDLFPDVIVFKKRYKSL